MIECHCGKCDVLAAELKAMGKDRQRMYSEHIEIIESQEAEIEQLFSRAKRAEAELAKRTAERDDLWEELRDQEADFRL